MLTYVFAVLAACANAASSVLQRKANRQVPKGQNLSLRLIASLLHERVWFGGIAALTAGFLLQAAALGTGTLSVVQPLLVLELPAALILASRVFRAPMHRREWGSAAVVTAGLAGLLYFLSPGPGRTASVRWYAWVTAAGVNLTVIAVMVTWARRGPAGRLRNGTARSARQAALLGVAAGSAFGLTAALMKGMTNTFSAGLGTLLTSWQLYGMIAAGALAMFLVQSALNAGRLLAVQPGLTLSNPIVAILWGVLVFGERVRGGAFLALAVVSTLIITGGVVILARSPLLAGQADQREQDKGPGLPRAGEPHGKAPARHQPDRAQHGGAGRR
jgi:drug/metabolite transporter (DMT)-like permease